MNVESGSSRGVDDDLVADLVARQVLLAGRALEVAVDRLALLLAVEHEKPDVRGRRVGLRWEERDDPPVQQHDRRWLGRRRAQVRQEEDETEQEHEPDDERAGVPAEALERDLRGTGGVADPAGAAAHVAVFDVRSAASARSLSTRRCASTRLASEARPRRTRMPVQRSNGSNVAAWMTRVPPATGSSRQLHSLSKPDAGDADAEPRVGPRLEALDARRRRAAGRAGPAPDRVVAAAGQDGAAGPRLQLREERAGQRRVVERRPHDPRRGLDEDAPLDAPRRRVDGRPVDRRRRSAVRYRPPSSAADRVPDRLHLEEGGDPFGALGGARRRASRSGPRRRRSGGARRRLMSSAASELDLGPQLVGDAPGVERVDVGVAGEDRHELRLAPGQDVDDAARHVGGGEHLGQRHGRQRPASRWR